MSFQHLAARLAFAILVLAALTAAAAVGGVRLGLMAYGAGLTVMAGAVALGLIALCCALAWLVFALRNNCGDGKRIGLVALIGAIALLWVPLSHVWRGLTAPAIVDASSNPEDPPRFVALARLRAPGMNPVAPDYQRQIHYKGEDNTVAYMLHTYYPMITKPYARLLTTKAKLFWHAFETAKRMGWQIVDYNAREGRIEATDTSFWFGQKSDIAIRVQAAGALGARLDIRSQSESGRRDFGGNIARIQDFFKEL